LSAWRNGFEKPGVLFPYSISQKGLPASFVLALAPQNVNAKPDTTLTFVCGSDQSIEPIPLTWANIVLAGDGRFYTPCSNGTHGLDHRELREETVLALGYASADPEQRWRAAQAYARNSTRRLPLGNETAGNRPTGTSLASATAMLDGLGGVVDQHTRLTPACNAEAQIFDPYGTPRHWQPGKLFMLLCDAPELSQRVTPSPLNAGPGYTRMVGGVSPY
jgi:hypothetical protein